MAKLVKKITTKYFVVNNAKKKVKIKKRTNSINEESQLQGAYEDMDYLFNIHRCIYKSGFMLQILLNNDIGLGVLDETAIDSDLGIFSFMSMYLNDNNYR